MQKKLTLIVVGVALACALHGGPAAAQEAAEQASAAPSIAAVDKASDGLAAQTAAVESAQARVATAREDLAAVQMRRLEKARVGRLEAAKSFVAAVVKAQEAGEDVSRYRAQAVEAVKALPLQANEALDQITARFTKPAEAKTAAELAAADARQAAGAREIDRVFNAAIQSLPLAKSLEVDLAGQEAALKERVADRAETISVYLDVAIEESAILEAQEKTLPEDTEIAALSAVAKKQVAHIAAALESTLGMMKTLDLEDDLYEQQLIAVTGEISTFDAEVIGGLVEGWSSSIMESVASGGPGLLLSIVLFAIIVFAFYKLAQFGQRMVEKGLSTANVQISQLLKRMISSTTRNAILLVGVLIALSQLGISLGPLLAGLGIAGFIVGFALQDALSNFASGMFILLYRPFDVGDLVEAAGVFGNVSKMSLVSTTILTLDNQTLVVPNNKIWGDVIKNVTAQRKRRVDLIFGISYGDDIPKAEKILADVVSQNEMVLEDPEPNIRVHELGDSSVNFVCRPWVKTEDYWEVWWDITKAVKMRFDEEGISIPFPQTDVHFPSGGPPAA